MTSPQPQPGMNEGGKAAATTTTDVAADLSDTARTETEKASDDMLERETHGQIMDPERDGQRNEDQQDDSMRAEMQAPTGPARASDENLPRQLTDPNDKNYTLPELQ